MRIDIISVASSDYGILSSVTATFNKYQDIEARFIFTGSHFEELNALNLDKLRKDIGLPSKVIQCRSSIGVSTFDSVGAISDMIKGFNKLWNDNKPDLVLLLGDRFEILSALNVAVLYGIPIAHMFGGECDVGHCIDTQIRNSITKSANIHFVSHDAYRKRLIDMGEEDWRIIIMGNPSISNPNKTNSLFLKKCKENNWPKDKVIAACYLPPTIHKDLIEIELESLLEALNSFRDYTIIWAGVNTDPGSKLVIEKIKQFCSKNSNNYFFRALGIELYHSLLQCAKVLIGNSSSGLLESASYGIPVINVGVRQTGRLGGTNVINVEGNEKKIKSALNKALYNKYFREKANSTQNPFFMKNSGEILVNGIKEIFNKFGHDRIMLKKSLKNNPKRIQGLVRVPEYD